jgi:hypothetical protein
LSRSTGLRDDEVGTQMTLWCLLCVLFFSRSCGMTWHLIL